MKKVNVQISKFTILMNVICTISYSPVIIASIWVIYLYLTEDKILSDKNDWVITKPYIGIPLILIGNTILIIDLYKKYTGKYQKNER